MNKMVMVIMMKERMFIGLNNEWWLESRTYINEASCTTNSRRLGVTFTLPCKYAPHSYCASSFV
jgi:hypothetical protein